LKKKKPLDSSQLSGLAYQEFGYALKLEKSRKLVLRKMERSTAASHHTVGLTHDDHIGGDDDEDRNYDGMVNFGVYGEGGDDDFDGDDDEGGGGYFPNPNAMMSQFDEVQESQPSYKNNDDGGFDDGIDQLQLDDAFHQAPKSYAELCREHIAKHMQGVDRYANASNLSMRVSEWQERLTPMLKEQDARRPFDIHEYGREIIRKCESVMKENNQLISKSSSRKLNEPIDFHKMTADKPQFEICRLFLASLQLSNNLNVKLHHTEGGVCGPNDLKLEVMNNQVGRDRFGDIKSNLKNKKNNRE
jgi:hypothetical protein